MLAKLAQFYTLTDRAAQAQGNLKMAAVGVSTPQEGREFKDSIYTAIRIREDALNKLKTALDERRISASAAYQEAKRLSDTSTLLTVARLFELCDSLGRGPDECMAAVGLKE